jgi:hypothetical protein
MLPSAIPIRLPGIDRFELRTIGQCDRFEALINADGVMRSNWELARVTINAALSNPSPEIVRLAWTFIAHAIQWDCRTLAA